MGFSASRLFPFLPSSAQAFGRNLCYLLGTYVACRFGFLLISYVHGYSPLGHMHLASQVDSRYCYMARFFVEG
jgi:hypothetical protein